MIELFMKDDCVYCKRVIEFLDENKIQYKKNNVLNEDNKETLIRIGGKLQVPFIIDKENGVEMYESNDIIEYLKTVIK